MTLSDEVLKRIRTEHAERETQAMEKQLKDQVANPYRERLKLLNLTFDDFDEQTCRFLLGKVDPVGVDIIKIGGAGYHNKQLSDNKYRAGSVYGNDYLI